MKNYKKGFTLIELLVVIAIIGILSSIVLASLSSARTKGEDAAKQSGLSNMRAQAELYYSNNSNTYASADKAATTCGPTDDNNGTNLFGETTVTGNLSTMIANVGGTKKCAATATAYAIETTISSGVYCVDSSGIAKSAASTLISGPTDVSCN